MISDLSLDPSKDEPTVILFHAELDSPGNAYGVPAEVDDQPDDPTLYSSFLKSRPQELETDAIALITRVQRKYPSLRCHIVHLSAASALPLIRSAKLSGLKLTVETCFHYLCLSADEIPDGRPQFKCCPPIREQTNRELLWDALKDGTLDCVVSDHSPCVTELKNLDDGDIMNAWGGISTLGLGLSLLWTEGNRRGVTIGQIVKWTSVKTAEHAGLSARKGQLKVGYDADLIIWNPEVTYKVRFGHICFTLRLANNFLGYQRVIEIQKQIVPI
jgi:allantoinase